SSRAHPRSLRACRQRTYRWPVQTTTPARPCCHRQGGHSRPRLAEDESRTAGAVIAAEECARIGSDEYALPCNYATRLRLAQQQIRSAAKPGSTQPAGSLLLEERNSQ